MNRLDFQKLAALRLSESQALLAAGFPDGSYYLAGYAMECALKACIAKRTREHDFPEKDSRDYYVHDFEKLLALARLKDELDNSARMNPLMQPNRIIVRNWSEESRYEAGRTVQEATDLLNAIEDPKGGLLPWVRQRW
jgi:HEPN domain